MIETLGYVIVAYLLISLPAGLLRPVLLDEPYQPLLAWPMVLMIFIVGAFMARSIVKDVPDEADENE